MSSESKPLLLPLFAPQVNSDWAWERLDSIADVFDCPHSTPALVDDGSSPFVVRSQDVRTGTILLNDVARVSNETYQERIKRAEPVFGDLVYSREGTYFGIAAEVPKGIKMCLGQRMVLIRPDRKRINHSYLKYWLNSPQVFAHIHGFRDGTVAERLNLPVIRGLAIGFPSLDVQMAIVQTLAALDDRITLLRETNQTLEALSQALFKSWFVDFDPVLARSEGRIPEGMDEATAALFPDSFQTSELREIPRGWRVASIRDMCSTITNGGTPSRSRPEFWSNGTVPWYKTGELKDGFMTSFSEFITQEAVQSSSAKVLSENSILMAIYAAPTVGRLGVLTVPATFNQACTGMVAHKSVGTWFLYLTLYFGRAWFNSRANGAAQQNISKAIVESYQSVLASDPVLKAFDEQAEVLFGQVRINSMRIDTLSALKDAILPRLISGQLRIPKAEAEIEALTA